MTEPKFCKDCKHFKDAWAYVCPFTGGCVSGPESCNQPPERELIRGNKIGADPIQMRSEEGACKPEAMLWEEKPAPEVVVKFTYGEAEPLKREPYLNMMHFEQPEPSQWWEFWK